MTGEPTLAPDLCVIGAGAAGLTAAAGAAAFGVSVVLVEAGRMGGECLNVGCVPSKALLAAARRAEMVRSAAAFGIEAGEPGIDRGRVAAHVRAVIDTLAPQDSEERMASLGVHVLRERARFLDTRTVAAGPHRIRARRTVLATGSRPAMPPIPGLDTVPVLTNDTVFDLRETPGHLLVLGAGPVGLELAQAHRRLGSEVTLVAAERPLAREDEAHADLVAGALAREGVRLLAPARVSRAEAGGPGVRLHVEQDGTPLLLEGTHLLVATGRRAVTDGLGLEEAGIRVGQHGIAVDAGLRTSNRRVYAIGDANGLMPLTHAASHQASLALRSILFRLPARFDAGLVPRVVYTDPELAAVGTLDPGPGGRVLRVPLAANDRAQAERDTHGEVALALDRRGRLAGASLVAAGAGEMIGLPALMLRRRLGARDLAGLVLPYPTIGEALRRAALDYCRPKMSAGVVRPILAVLRSLG